MIRVSNQDSPWTIEIPLVLSLEIRYICSIIDRNTFEPLDVTIYVYGPWLEKRESVSLAHRGVWSLRTVETWSETQI